jgi:hypothetical protein
MLRLCGGFVRVWWCRGRVRKIELDRRSGKEVESKIKAIESPSRVRASICLHTDNSRRQIAPMRAKWHVALSRSNVSSLRQDVISARDSMILVSIHCSLRCLCWKGTLAQYIGRLHRDFCGKTNVIVYDYVDSSVPILARMATRRKAGYRPLGYVINPVKSSAEF